AVFDQQLNIDDYNNIYIKRMPNTVTTSIAAHLTTILLNLIENELAIPKQDIHNSALVDALLIKTGVDNYLMSLYSFFHNQY
ncbi:17723_t:CDS:2, partial [Funneliformis caledonium]